MFLKKLIWCALFFLPETKTLERYSIVTTESGDVKGKLNVFNGMAYYSYEGIPYAENPTGKLRFGPPVPRRPWTGILDATEQGPICSQAEFLHRVEETTEDCLIINIYVPIKRTKTSTPVILYIHGGYLQYNSGRTRNVFSPELLLEREIIFVSVNHRLGPFGFLNLEIEEASGNAGIKDILLSLKWLKQNIDKFGGDVDKITVLGHSAGSLIINYLLLTNQSAGLFDQAILMSGSVFAPRSFAKHPKDISMLLVKELGIQTDDTYKILEYLQNIDATKISHAFYNMSKSDENPLRMYAPFVTSKEVQSNHALFTYNPIEAFRKNAVIPLNIPIIVGLTSQEAKVIKNHVINQFGVFKIRANPEILVPSNIEYPIGSERSHNLTELISETYFGKNMQDLKLSTTIEYISDTQYNYGVSYWIEKHQHMTGSNQLYFYIFDFIGDLNSENRDASINGTNHGADVHYIFLSNRTKPLIGNIDEKSQRMMNTMLNLVSNFVYYGNPSPDNINDNKHKLLKWLDYGEEQNYLALNENPVVEKFNVNPMYTRMKFWDKVYSEYYEYVDNGGEIQKKIIP